MTFCGRAALMGTDGSLVVEKIVFASQSYDVTLYIAPLAPLPCPSEVPLWRFIFMRYDYEKSSSVNCFRVCG